MAIKKESKIAEKSFEFALKIIQLYKELQADNEFLISKQLLRSGTSIGANVQKSSAAFSKKRFRTQNIKRIKRSKRNQILATIIT
ncbi:four helix bundle protein [Kordia sp.]|uniref:four helix bundle protein n=1 Tax=Kordia sp. TaxID=1965332 RepID=UPI003450DAA1